MKCDHSSVVVALQRRTPEMIAENVFDNCRSRNPVVKALIGSLLDRMLTMVRPIAPHRLLEVGCDDGYVLDFLSGQLNPVCAVGVDLSRDVVSRPKRSCPRLAFWVDPAYCLPYAAPLFDLIVVSEDLKHLALCIVGQLGRASHFVQGHDASRRSQLLALSFMIIQPRRRVCQLVGYTWLVSCW